MKQLRLGVVLETWYSTWYVELTFFLFCCLFHFRHVLLYSVLRTESGR